jgi:hypothetical protein
MKWENLSKLLDQIEQDITRLGFFELSTKRGNVTKIFFL